MALTTPKEVLEALRKDGISGIGLFVTHQIVPLRNQFGEIDGIYWRRYGAAYGRWMDAENFPKVDWELVIFLFKGNFAIEWKVISPKDLAELDKSEPLIARRRKGL